jgi:hypothetical protein
VGSVHLKATGLDNEDLDRLQAEIDKVPKVVNAIEEHYPGIYQNHFAELGKVQKH